ncbi:exopolygalacturonase-like [Musa acuminata AAA Group]|uniref:exopolygalacturonase-like n=1 Tax=Musa acuminata AAA Group TaxID=214697 RepID=UPI0031D76747
MACAQSVKFVNTNNTIVKDITSLNSKFFHMALLGCHNFKGSGITITAPATSPNTDGIHLEGNSGVTIASSKIRTGDDCVSIGHGNSFVTISGITCGPGRGISVGSLGRYKDEEDVQNIVVKDSKLIGTMNGVRVKTWANSPVKTSAINMTFENLVMRNVGNPIVIDQTYCPYDKCDNSVSDEATLFVLVFLSWSCCGWKRFLMHAGVVQGEAYRRPLQEHKGDDDVTGGGDVEVQQGDALREAQPPRRQPPTRRSREHILHLSQRQGRVQWHKQPPTVRVIHIAWITNLLGIYKCFGIHLANKVRQGYKMG